MVYSKFVTFKVYYNYCTRNLLDMIIQEINIWLIFECLIFTQKVKEWLSLSYNAAKNCHILPVIWENYSVYRKLLSKTKQKKRKEKNIKWNKRMEKNIKNGR